MKSEFARLEKKTSAYQSEAKKIMARFNIGSDDGSSLSDSIQNLDEAVAEIEKDFQKWRAAKKRNAILTNKVKCFLESL